MSDAYDNDNDPAVKFTSVLVNKLSNNLFDRRGNVLTKFGPVRP